MSAPTIRATRASASGITFDLQGALAASRNMALLAEFLPQSEKRALGTLRRKLGPETRRDIQREYQVKAGRVNANLRVSPSSDGMRVLGYFRGIGLRNFGARQTGAGVTAQVLRTGSRSLRGGAFFAPLLGGAAGSNLHVVKRKGEARVMTKGRYVGKRRQPLAVEYGPTVAQMLRKDGRPQRIADFAVGVVGKEAERLIELELRKPTPGATA